MQCLTCRDYFGYTITEKILLAMIVPVKFAAYFGVIVVADT